MPLVVWLVQAWWYRDDCSKIIGIYASKKSAQAEVNRRLKKDAIWTYDIRRYTVVTPTRKVK